MQNKVSYVVIIILAFVCLVLSMRIGRDGAPVQSLAPAVDSAMEQADSPSGGVSVSSEEKKNFLADEYVTTFKMVQKDIARRKGTEEGEASEEEKAAKEAKKRRKR